MKQDDRILYSFIENNIDNRHYCFYRHDSLPSDYSPPHSLIIIRNNPTFLTIIMTNYGLKNGKKIINNTFCTWFRRNYRQQFHSAINIPQLQLLQVNTVLNNIEIL